MVKIKIAAQRAGEWKEVGQLDVDMVHRIGEVVALDEPEHGTNLPVGDYEVVQVKHYHDWQYPEQSEILVFLRDRRQETGPAMHRLLLLLERLWQHAV